MKFEFALLLLLGSITSTLQVSYFTLQFLNMQFIDHSIKSKKSDVKNEKKKVQ